MALSEGARKPLALSSLAWRREVSGKSWEWSLQATTVQRVRSVGVLGRRGFALESAAGSVCCPMPTYQAARGCCRAACRCFDGVQRGHNPRYCRPGLIRKQVEEECFVEIVPDHSLCDRETSCTDVPTRRVAGTICVAMHKVIPELVTMKKYSKISWWTSIDTFVSHNERAPSHGFLCFLACAHLSCIHSWCFVA